MELTITVPEEVEHILARLYPFLERQHRNGVSLLFATADIFNVGEKCDVEKVSLIVRTLSLLFMTPVSKMDKVELRTESRSKRSRH
ncbi:MAG: hypothetical protein H0W76_06700 [Pyrinomonadaceae bacterium]|nr:hypothetical protein [Pyrinomonadaceae bacterium]